MPLFTSTLQTPWLVMSLAAISACCSDSVSFPAQQPVMVRSYHVNKQRGSNLLSVNKALHNVVISPHSCLHFIKHAYFGEVMIRPSLTAHPASPICLARWHTCESGKLCLIRGQCGNAVHELWRDWPFHTPTVQQHRNTSFLGYGAYPGIHVFWDLPLQQHHACCLHKLHNQAAFREGTCTQGSLL